MGDYHRSSDELSKSVRTTYREEFVDPLYWKPNCKNFQIMDWNKWESLNPKVPQVFDPPQKYTFYKESINIPLWWWNRSCYLLPCANYCLSGTKPETAYISDTKSEVLVKKLLTPGPSNPHVVPEPFRNKLFWTENNIAPETLVSFNRWAWRPQSDEGRVIGLGNLLYDWTNNPTCWGRIFSIGQNDLFCNVQMSPNGKWVLLATFNDPSINGEVDYLHNT